MTKGLPAGKDEPRMRFPRTGNFIHPHTFFFWLAVLLILALPVRCGLAYLQDGAFSWRGPLADAGTMGLLAASSWLMSRSRSLWIWAASLLLLLMFLLHMVFFGVARFSGRGFDSGFFLSLQADSIGVAWHQYRYLFVLFGLGALALGTILAVCAKRMRVPTGSVALLLALVSSGALAISYQSTPEWLLASGIRAWYAPVELKLPAARLAAWRKSPLVNLNLVSKQSVEALAATPPKNLIMLYVESGGVALAPADQYPGLMPNMKRLVAQYGLVPHIHASSYVTIEGLVNTQCGTLLPFGHGHDETSVFGNKVETMPCLADVLAKAGYRQTFLEGTERQFAGTGSFLKLHGYDKVIGIEDWSRMGLHPRPDTWGLSDVDLFKQSLVELERLKASGHPFNLTLFTIGSHVPGFMYRECKPYGDGSRQFLNAVHCTDQLVQQWIGQLRSGGWLNDNTLLVITGDHQIFPNPHMKQLFGGAAVADHRLPLIVIGKHAKPELKDGAGYDIAPTVLDLLGVKTNARFALGRSLMRNDRTLPYYATRYGDMLGETRYTPYASHDCGVETGRRFPGMQTLNSCEREELRTVLQEMAAAYSSKPAQLRCNAAVPLRVMVPSNPHKELQLQMTDVNLAERFHPHGFSIEPNRPGLYLLQLDAYGSVVDQRFASPETAAQWPAASVSTHSAMVIVWRPDGSGASLPKWLTQWGMTGQGGVWVYRLDAKSGAQLLEHVSPDHALTLSAHACESLLN